MNQGGGLVLSFVTRANTQESVSQLFGVIATSPCIRLTKPPAGVARWLGSRMRAILPNQNIPAAVESKVRSSPLYRRAGVILPKLLTPPSVPFSRPRSGKG
jgi:hypothetical protein